MTEKNKTTTGFDVTFDFLPEDLGLFKIIVTL